MELHAVNRQARTLGVEEEFLLVDPRSGYPVAASEGALAAARHARELVNAGVTPGAAPQLTSEVNREQIEVISPPASTLDELAVSLTAGRRMVDLAAMAVGLRAVALGTSVLSTTTHLAPSPRYAAMETQFALTLHEQLACGFHVHVSIADAEEGVAVIDRIRPWLPVVLALSANSPFWNGRDSGFASYRYQAWGRWPTAGATDLFGSARAYDRVVESLTETRVLLDAGMIYFDARLSARHPTVEVRVADVCLVPEHAVALAGLVRALVENAAREWREGRPPTPVPTSMLRLAMWSASRYGVGQQLIDPLHGEPYSAREAADAVLARAQSSLIDTGDRERVEGMVDEMFRTGTGAHRQRTTLVRTRSMGAVVTDAIEMTHQGAGSGAPPAGRGPQGVPPPAERIAS